MRDDFVTTQIASAAPLQVREAGASAGSSISDLGGMIRNALSEPLDNEGSFSPREKVKAFRHWVHVAVCRIRDAVSGTPLRVMQSASQAGDDPVEVLDLDDDMLALMENPNPNTTSTEFWQETMTYLELTGNAVWLKVRDGFGVRELWNLPTQFMKPKLVNGPRPLACYTIDIGGVAVPIPVEDVVHLKYPSPHNRFWGGAPLDAISLAVRATDRMKASQYHAFTNQILTDLIFSTDQTLTESTFERIMATLLDRYGGVTNTKRPMVLEQNLKADFLRRPVAEMDYPDSLQITREEILAVYGVPPIVAGIVKDANRSNSDTQRKNFLAGTIVSRLDLIQKRINKDLAPEFGQGRWVEFANPVPEDRAIKTAENNIYTKAGIKAPNETRKELGLPEEPWGEFPQWVYEFQAKHGYMPGEAPPPKPDPLPPELQPFDGGDDPPGPDDAGDNETGDAGGAADSDRRIRRRPARARTFSAERRSLSPRHREVIRQSEHDRDKLEHLFARTLREFFGQQLVRIKANLPRLFVGVPKSRSMVVSARVPLYLVQPINARIYPDCSLSLVSLTDGVCSIRAGINTEICCHGDGIELQQVEIRDLSPDLKGGLDDWNAAAEQLANRMRARLEAAMNAGGALQLGAAGIEGRFDLSNPLAGAWLNAKDRDYWANTVGLTTQQRLSERLAEVLNDAPDIEQLADVVEEVMGDRIRSSAHTIARTEVGGAYNAAGHIVREQHKISEVEWMATMDSRTRTQPNGGHLAADGQIRKRGVKFDVAGEKLDYPGDPKGSVWNIASCRCVATAIPAESDEIAPGFGDESSTTLSGGPAPAPATSATVVPTFGRSKARIVLSEGLEAAALSAMLAAMLGDGITKRYLPSLAGATDDAAVEVSHKSTPAGDVLTMHVAGFGYRATRELFQDDAGLTVLRNVGMEATGSGNNVSAKLLGRQVEQAAALGVDRIEINAGGDGARVWPRLGFDAPLSKSLEKKLPDDIEAERVSDLMFSPEGRDFWDSHAAEFTGGRSSAQIPLAFDLSRRSQSRRILNRYLARKAEAGAF